jgi:hypothetical protein
MSDNAKRTGAAIEAQYQLLMWLALMIENFPKTHKFAVGDRIYAVALDVLEALIEATCTRDRHQQHLRRANLGISGGLDHRRLLGSVSTNFDYCANIIFNQKLFLGHVTGFDP